MGRINTQALPQNGDGYSMGAGDLLVLLDRCKTKDRRAQKQLYDCFAAYLYAVVRRYVVEQADADHILNETFFKIFTHLDDYNASGSFEAWIRRIAVNTALDFIRSRKVYFQIDNGQDDETPKFEVIVQETSVSGLAYKELLAVVHTLPDAQRSVFNLFVFENCSHKEIARLLDISENNSRWYLNDARRRLKQKLDTLM